MVLAWHRTPGTRTRRVRPGRIRPGTIRYRTIRHPTIRYGAAVAVALTLAVSAVAAAEPAASAGTAAATASCPWVHSRAPVASRWTVSPGRYALMVGDSSARLPLIAHVNLGGNG